MRGPKQKIITIITLVVFITTGIISPVFVPKAKADIVGDFTKSCLGLGETLIKIEEFLSPDKVPSSDTKAQAELIKFDAKQCLRRLKDLAIVTAHNFLKKRLLDQLVDQTVAWIQNGDEPRFVSNFNQFLNDAKDAAIGDTLRDIGLGKLCDGTFKAKLELTLGKRTPQKFTQDVTCTLNQVVSNINAFRNDFKNGGWLGLQEAANPRNNIFGLKLMVADKVSRDIFDKQEAAKTEVAATGYTSQKKCLEYQLLDTQTGDIFEQGKFYPIGSGGTDVWVGLNPVPANSDGTPPNSYDAAINSSRAYWHCSKDQIVTPAHTAAEITAKTAGLDYDYILSSQDVSSYITAISDALINRLTTEAGKGLRGLFKGGGSPSRGEAAYRDTTYINSDTNAAIQNYNNTLHEDYDYSTTTIAASETNLLSVLAQATSTLINAKTKFNNASSSNSNLICFLDHSTTGGTPPCDQRGLIQCITASENPLKCPSPYRSTSPIEDTAATLSNAQLRQSTISSFTTQTQTLLNQANALKTQIQNANTANDLNTAITDTQSFLSTAQNLETQSNVLLNEIQPLYDAALEQRTQCNNSCNNLYP